MQAPPARSGRLKSSAPTDLGNATRDLSRTRENYQSRNFFEHWLEYVNRVFFRREPMKIRPKS